MLTIKESLLIDITTSAAATVLLLSNINTNQLHQEWVESRIIPPLSAQVPPQWALQLCCSNQDRSLF